VHRFGGDGSLSLFLRIRVNSDGIFVSHPFVRQNAAFFLFLSRSPVSPSVLFSDARNFGLFFFLLCVAPQAVLFPFLALPVPFTFSHSCRRSQLLALNTQTSVGFFVIFSMRCAG